MVLNWIWISFFLIAFTVAVIRLCMGDAGVFQEIMDSTFSSAKTGFEISLGLTGVLSLWLGIMKIGEKGGLVNTFARWLSPVFSRLFPDLPKNDPAYGHIFMNVAANMLGLDNAATPMGLKAMERMQELNKTKDVASNPMIMFLVLNTSGLTIIPVSVLVYRAQMGAAQPADVFIPILLATFFSTLVGLLVTCFIQKIRFDKVLIGFVGGLSVLVALIIWGFSRLPAVKIGPVSTSAANIILFVVIIGFIISGIKARINVYEAFVEGAKDGFTTAVKIIPYLIAILVGIGVFRASGAMDAVVNGVAWCADKCGLDTQFVGALPRRRTRSDDRCHDHIRGRFVHRTSGLPVPGLDRYHILHPGGLFWQCEHQEHTSRCGLRPSGRLGGYSGRHIPGLSVLCINFNNYDIISD